MAEAEVVIDCAGAAMGGAARFLGELDAYLATNSVSATVIGRNRGLSPGWLARREMTTDPRKRRVALNNVSFSRRGGTRTVLLRNALHFASDGELDSLGYTPPRSLRTQVPIVRAAARRADRIIVPCTAMADRVTTYLPGVEGRMVVRPHPVAPRPWAGRASTERAVLLPVLNAAYKRLDLHLTNLLAADENGEVIERLYVTADAADFSPSLGADARISFLGRLRASELDSYWERVRAIYFPTQLESFGYPLAEARANGRRVIALDTEQNREIAGDALAGFQLDEPSSLRSALVEALDKAAEPDPFPFDPTRYFDRLIGGLDV